MKRLEILGLATLLTIVTPGAALARRGGIPFANDMIVPLLISGGVMAVMLVVVELTKPKGVPTNELYAIEKEGVFASVWRVMQATALVTAGIAAYGVYLGFTL